MQITECFSILVASGFGHRCKDLKQVLHNRLLVRDTATQESLVELHKFGKDGQPQAHRALSQRLSRDVLHLFKGVERKYFLRPIPQSAQN